MMLFELLQSYRSHLEATFRKETARTYHNRICFLFEGQSLTDTVNCFDMQKVVSQLSKVKYKNAFSQCKNAFIHFCAFQHIKIPATIDAEIKRLEKQCHKKYRKLKHVSYQFIKNKIDHIRNAKLRLSYQVMLATGLRVFELSQITSNDCTMIDNMVIFHFIGKGGNSESVTLDKKEYPRIFETVKVQLESIAPNKKLFYSAIYLQNKAKELGFGCHDLRRACAKLEYQKSNSKTQVMKKLRHSQLKNTSIYLKSRIDL